MSEHHELPSIWAEFGNLASTGKDAVLEFLKSGKVKADNDLQDARMRVCLKCEFLTDNFRCAKCGCFVKAKSALLTGTCPLRKWPNSLEEVKKIA